MLSDFQQAWRGLRNRPLFTVASVLSLAIGIGANSAIFSFVNAILLSPLPFPNSDRLVLLQETVDGRDANGSPQRWKDWASQQDVLEAVMAYYSESMSLTTSESSERVNAWRTFGDPLATYGIRPAAGRDFTSDERQGQAGAAMLGYGFWKRRFGADTAALGRPLILNGRSATIVGVLPPSFDTEAVDVVVPETVQTMGRSARFLTQVGRLQPDIPARMAEERLRAAAAGLRRQYPDSDRGLGIQVIAYREAIAATARMPLLILLGAVGFVLCSACLNIASLLLQRATGRRAELAMRLALGASTLRIARLLLAEGLLLGLLGGLVGLFVAMWGIDGLKLLVPDETPRLSEVRLDWPVAGFTALLAFITAVLCSFAPVLQNARPDLQSTLRSGGRVAGSRHWLQRSLVVVQVAISLTLLIGAGLLTRSLLHLQSRPIGIRSASLIAFQSPIGWNVADDRVQRVIGDVLASLRAIPGVEAAEYTDRLPNGGGASDAKVDIAGRAEAELSRLPELHGRSISYGYLAVAGVPLRRGRYLTEDDARAEARNAVINESAARLYFPNEDPIGKRIGMKFTPNPTRFFEIVGVVGDVPTSARSQTVPPMMYLDFHHQFWPIGTYVVRTSLPLNSIAAQIRKAVFSVDRSQVVENLRTVDAALSRSYAQPRMNAGLSGAFATAALLLAAIGLYGLLSNSVTERAKELGIRTALGADPRSLLRLVLSDAVPLIALGVAAGLAGAWGMSGLLRRLLFGLTPADPTAVLLAAGVLLSAAAIACYLPARRAAQVNPASVLRL